MKMFSLSKYWWVTAVVLGLLLGVATSYSDVLTDLAFINGLSASSELWRLPAVLLNSFTVWFFVAFLAALFAPNSLKARVSGAALALFSATFGYYAYGMVFGDRAAVEPRTLMLYVGAWLCASAVGALIAGVGVFYTKRWPLALVLAAAVPVAEIIYRGGLSGYPFIGDWVSELGKYILLVVAVGVVICGIVLHRFHRLKNV